MLEAIISAVGLLLVFEGLMPFISPEKFRRYLAVLLTLDNRTIRRSGFISMIIGAAIIYFTRHGGI